MGNFIYFIIALIVLAVVTTLIIKEVRTRKEFSYMVSRCSKYVKGTVKEIQKTPDGKFLPLFSVVDEGSVYELPYYRKTEQNEFSVGRDYDLFIDNEQLMVAMTDSDRNQSEDNTSLYLMMFIAVFTVLSFLMVILKTNNPELSNYLALVLGGGAFYSVAEIFNKHDRIKKEQTSYLTDATIIDYQIRHEDDGSNVYFPVYQYYYGDQQYTAVSDVSQSNRSEFRRGQTVQIALDPANPQNSSISALSKRGFTILRIFKLLGFILVVIGLALIGMSIL